MRRLSYILTLLCLLLLAGCEHKEVPILTPGGDTTPTDTVQQPQDPTATMPEANKLVVYECNERLFAQNNAFKSIKDYLPTLQEMQVNVLWLMPIHPRGTVNSVNSPYCVKDFKAIDPKFGTLDDLKDLVNECHRRGMYVILDWVANHTALDNQWYIDNKDTWYTTPVGDEKNWNDVKPLNYNNQDVRAAMTDALVYWIKEADVDGYRCDYAHGVPDDYWQSAITAMRAEKPGIFMLAETSRTELYAAGFDWLYSWSYLGAIQKLYSGSRTIASLLSTSRSEYNSTPAGKERLRYTTTHDASSENAPSSWYKTADGQLSAFALTIFVGGIPMIYSSQEIGDMNKVNFFNYSIKKFEATNPTLLKYAQLMKAYIATAEARKGDLTDYSTDKVAIIGRSQKYNGAEKSVLVVANTTNANQEATLPSQWQREQVTNALTGETMYTPKVQTLEPYQYLIFTK